MKTNTKVLMTILIFSSLLMQAQIVEEKLEVEDTLNIEVPDLSRFDYYPNLQAYYDRKTTLFIFKENGIWVSDSAIPLHYRGYSVRNGFHVLIENYSGDEPYTLLATHKLKYPADYSTKRQRVIVVVTAN
ncbi:hypothetical protein ACSVH2_10580 [Flavobacterium sp. RSB2_4_14]|uniref:hypothetical protein n=1 Tax=Flavobacterium sp. RSB2_4_14 TaxID=3447665 RepID=UPI003F307ACF